MMSTARSAFNPLFLLTLAVPLLAQAPDAAPEQQGLPARATPADYMAAALAGKITLAAEFKGHSIPNSQEPLQSEDYVAVEIALFGPPDSKLVITASDFSLRVNGKKPPLPAQPFGLVAKGIKDPEWAPPEASPESKSKTGLTGGAGGAGNQRNPGDPPPLPPKPPIELLRNWQLRVRKAAIAEGERALPQAGLIFFQHRGKTENIRTLELVYEGPAGSAVIPLQ